MSRWSVRLARVCARRPGRVLAAWAIALAAALVSAALLLPGALTTRATVATDLESTVGHDLLTERLHDPNPLGGDIVIVRSARLLVDDPAYESFVRRLALQITATGVTKPVATGYDLPEPTLVSADRHATLLPLAFTGGEPQRRVGKVIGVVERAGHDTRFTVDITGDASMGHDFLAASRADLKTGELYVGLPAALVILLLVFGSVVAGALPLLLALVCIPVALGLTGCIGQGWQLSFFIVNMVAAMGLALGIDYSLLIVSRYREARRLGQPPPAAIETAAGTAGTAVVFSGLSFTVALLGLMLVPDTVLRSLAAGSMIIGIVTVTAALTLLPAALSRLGDRVEALRMPLMHAAARSGLRAERRLWNGVVRVVVRRPLVSLGLAATALLLCALPVVHLTTGSSGLADAPDSLRSKRGAVALDRDFPGSDRAGPARVVVDGAVSDPPVRAAIDRFREGLRTDRRFGPTRLALHPDANLAVVDVPMPGDPYDRPARAALRVLRSEHVRPAFGQVGEARAVVAGATAFSVDYTAFMRRWLPIVVAFVLGLTFLLLTVVFRSVVLPLKAVLLNLLSVGAAYGLLVLVFQEGVGAAALGLRRVDSVEPWVPVFLFSVLFALSMDYHVFLLSRIRERYARTGRTAEAVAHGISSTGRIITGAALIIVATFAGLATGDLVGLQQLGFGIAVALLLDATIIRSVIVPSSMVLLGRWNWYLPRRLRWLPELQVEPPRAAEPDLVATRGR